MIIEIPIRTQTECNTNEHWRVRALRAKMQVEAVRLHLRGKRISLPCVVTLTRIAPGTLDAHDNLPSALKHVVDAIATELGVPDNDPRITWQYAQEKRSRLRGHPARTVATKYAVRVEIRCVETSDP
jgi:hypothetical protein